MRRLIYLISRLLLLVGALLPLGCERGPTGGAGGTPETLIVNVAHPADRKVQDYVYYTGRTNAKNAVTVVPRVTGYLEKMPFKEGSEVKKAELLFEIDDRPYKAQYEAAKAAVAQNEASLRYAKATNERFKELEKKSSGAVSKQELDQYQAQEDQAIANLNLAKANLISAKLNLDWCSIYSPIDGIISRYYLTVGNLVNQDVTQLTTLVSLDPMYAYFDVDEPTLLRIKQAINEGKIQASKATPVDMGLVGEEGFPHVGTVNFVDNQVNAGTGSISVRGEFPNEKPKGGTYLLLPGMFVRIRLPIGTAQPVLLVKDSYITSEQGRKYVYVVDTNNKVERRDVTVGSLQDDGLRVIYSGLKKEDWVLCGALQQVRVRMTVGMQKLEQMPSLTVPATPVQAEKQQPPAGKK